MALSFNSCNKKGCTDPLASNFNEKSKKEDGSCEYKPSTIKLNFTHNFNGATITKDQFHQMDYVTAHGESLEFSKLQYSISDVRFYLPNGDSVYVNGSYHLTDLENESTLIYTLPDLASFVTGKEYKGVFTGVGFNYGFNNEDNTSGAYADLNVASWSWPEMIGGGYHQLKMEGKFINTDAETVSFLFHNGSRTKNGAGEIETNYRFIKLDNSAFNLTTATTIEVKMNMANWFQNPNEWDLNVDYTMLMGNYDAQIRMTQNAGDVFSVGTISQ